MREILFNPWNKVYCTPSFSIVYHKIVAWNEHNCTGLRFGNIFHKSLLEWSLRFLFQCFKNDVFKKIQQIFEIQQDIYPTSRISSPVKNPPLSIGSSTVFSVLDILVKPFISCLIWKGGTTGHASDCSLCHWGRGWGEPGQYDKPGCTNAKRWWNCYFLGARKSEDRG